MLKQPSLSIIEAASTAPKRTTFFAGTSSILYQNYDSSSHPYDIDLDDDSSVISLESFTSICGDDSPCTAKTRLDKVEVSQKSHGRYWDESKNRLPYLKPTPSVCYVHSPTSSISRDDRKVINKDRVIRPLFSSLMGTFPKNLDSSFSSTDIPPAEVHVLPVATPISATRVMPCCDLCDRKDTELQKQAQEIEALKGLVTHLVTVLGQSLAANQQGPAKEPQHQAGSQVPSVARPPALHQDEASSSTECPAVPSISSEEGKASIMSPDVTPRGSSSNSTMLRLSRLRQLKEESNATKSRSPRMGKRHLYVSVNGHWGYYSGPVLEQNVPLQGCVIRFDNGDLYLGDMICYVPSTSFFSDEHGLRFHGRGTLYRKDGSIIRGFFHKHQLIE